jgi:hypothetical protein
VRLGAAVRPGINAPHDWPKRKKTEPLQIFVAWRGANAALMNAPQTGPLNSKQTLKFVRPAQRKCSQDGMHRVTGQTQNRHHPHQRLLAQSMLPGRTTTDQRKERGTSKLFGAAQGYG